MRTMFLFAVGVVICCSKRSMYPFSFLLLLLSKDTIMTDTYVSFAPIHSRHSGDAILVVNATISGTDATNIFTVNCVRGTQRPYNRFAVQFMVAYDIVLDFLMGI